MDRRASYFIICLVWTLFVFGAVSACSILATRPVQEMSDTAAAIKAAREVQADTVTPELFRQANEMYNLARREYKFKNFQLATDYATKARLLAEEAEFTAVRSGVDRGSGDSVESTPADEPTHESIPEPTGTPAEEYDQRKAADDALNASPSPQPSPTPTPASTFIQGPPGPKGP